MMFELIPLLLFLTVCGALMLGYPVALTLAGTSLLFASLGILFGGFDPALLKAMPDRLFGVISNINLVAIPLFVMMGTTLERSKISEELLENMAILFSGIKGGLGISVIIVGTLLAASTGIVGATVITMGLISLPTMLKNGYNPSLATGTICATGTLGQIIPPSIALILLGDVLSRSHQQVQINMGVLNPEPISIGDLFIGAITPGLLLVVAYIIYMLLVAFFKPSAAPANKACLNISVREVLKSVFPPIALIVLVLGSILSGKATTTEASSVGAIGALALAGIEKKLSFKILNDIAQSTAKITTMVFTIVISASLFSLVFRGFQGEEFIANIFEHLPGGLLGATLMVMLIIFLLGFILDFIEITFVVVPLVSPALFAMGMDPLLLGILIAINIQTSFLTPPFGFALFYLRGVTPDSIPTSAIYKGVIPFIVMQLILLITVALFPQIVTWLPGQL